MRPPARAVAGCAVLAAASLALAACSSPSGPEPWACTAEARPSVTVSVVDEGGVPLPGATVTWRVDGGELRGAECVDPLSPPAGCAEFVAGWEVPGLFEVAAARPGRLAAGAVVRVAMDDAGCHVVSQRVVLPLAPR